MPPVYSSEHNQSSRAMTESSLFFTAGDSCSIVSENCGELGELRHLVSFEEGIERRLNGRTDRQYKG